MIKQTDLSEKLLRKNDELSPKQTRIHEIVSAIGLVDPSMVTELGGIDIDALRKLFDVESIPTGKSGYELQFVGKNLARFDADSPREHEILVDKALSKNFDDTQNALIIGDNLKALKILQQNYYNKIKMIYIDPPYNRDSDNFVFSDHFSYSNDDLKRILDVGDEELQFITNIYGSRTHSGWLAFMYSRLKLARTLLSDDGVMFISIDDSEAYNLNVLCNEIFGELHTDCFVWRKSGVSRDGKMKNTTTFRKDHEYVLVCFKNQRALKKTLDFPRWQNKYGNLDNDPRGPFKPGSMSRKKEASNRDSPNYYTVQSPSGKEFTRQFDYSKEEFDKLDADQRIYWGKKGDAVPQRKIFEKEKREVNTSSILEEGTTTDGSKEIDEILAYEGIGKELRPKPVALMKRLVQIATDVDSDDIVLDFFAGSGTTGQSVIEQNAEDGGNRKFILVQLDEDIDRENSPATYEYCKKKRIPTNIASLTLKRLDRFGSLYSSNNDVTDHSTDIGYRVFHITPRPEITERSSDEIHTFNITNLRKNKIDAVFNLLISSARPLDSKIETIQLNKLYRVDDDYFLVGNIENTLFDEIRSLRVFVDGWGDLDLGIFMGIESSDRLTVVY